MTTYTVRTSVALFLMLVLFLLVGLGDLPDANHCRGVVAKAWGDTAPYCLSAADETGTWDGTAANPDTLRAVVIWIAFSDSVDSLLYPDCAGGNGRDHTVLDDDLPSWYRSVETGLEEYIDYQSYGKMYLDVTTALQPGADSLKAWPAGAPHTPCYWLYAAADTSIECGSSSKAEACVNLYIVEEVEDELGPGYFDDIDRVLFIHRANAFTSNYVAGWGGNNQYTCDECPYEGLRTVQRPVTPGEGGEASGNEDGTKWVLAHEFGHTIGVNHLPRSSPENDNFINYGHYGVMRSSVPTPVDFTDGSFVPYHPWQLTAWTGSGLPGWIDTTSAVDNISSNTLDVRIYDIRDEDDHNIVAVDTQVATYASEFWLIHHQETSFDELYGGDRLAIWHMRDPRNISSSVITDIDLEVATGKYAPPCPGSTPDPVAGLDSLECREGYRGDVSDLYADAGPDTLGPNSNPSSADYYSSTFPDSQIVSTGLSIQDIRLDYPSPIAGGPARIDSEAGGLRADPPKEYWVDVIYAGRGNSPFLYTWNGRNFPRLVNILSGSGYVEGSASHYDTGSDFLVLPTQLPHETGQYVFKLREDGISTNYLDKIAVNVVDHQAGVAIACSGAGDVVGYVDAVRPHAVAGLPGAAAAALGDRGKPIHASPGTTAVVEWSDLEATPGQGGIVLSTSGRAADDMPDSGGLLIERPDGLGGWTEVAWVSPRSTFTDSYIGDSELGRTGEDLQLRITWLDYHALDYLVFVSNAPTGSWTASEVPPDSALVAYQGTVLDELTALDGSFALVRPGEKLTIAIPFVPPLPDRERSLVLRTHGYYVTPEEGDLPAGQVSRSTIGYVDQAHPNPFNPTTQLSFGLHRGADVALKIYSVTGQLVRMGIPRIPDTYSTRWRPPVPRDSGQPFHVMADTWRRSDAA